ncbi:MFS transporter, DHA2 family, multidrug resistance protein [Dyadobacter soli]|uniref:MFS transporter, DHA2 family, multidrug resistance protein n=1 Tax=Dyadobacter soli TaxID=659014 RepID=A0A1G7Y3A7_9BACT|nr:MFS transporter [Dyadobacter soli]SDG90911.1 MFS transporter, DHA2 family, multidrug resistance protein [Dyadobacter soli]
MKPVYFKSWVGKWPWAMRIGLFMMLLSALVQLGMFVLTQAYMVSYLGAQPEDVSFAIMSTYAGIITVIPVQFRFFRYFQTRSYLLVNMMLAIALNCICLQCRDVDQFLAIRFLQGIVSGGIIVFTLHLIISRLPSDRVQTVAPAVFYGTMLSNTVLIGLVAGVVVESADWQSTYYYLILFQVLMLLVMLSMLRRVSGHRPYPLYQIDWIGMLLFACAALALAYTTIYGSKYDWFTDPRIRYGAAVATIGIVLFLYRQHIAKRPAIHLRIFRSPNFVAGVCLLAIYYGSKDSVNLIFSYTAGLLKWSTFQVIQLGACNMAGMVGLLIISTRMLLAKKVTIRTLLITGFALLGAFNFWMCFLITPDLSYADLLLPVMMQGAASGLLFVPIMIFVLSSAPKDTGASGLAVAAYTRFTATLHSIAGFYNLQLYFNQHFKERFLARLTPENLNVAARLDQYRSVFLTKGFTNQQAERLADAAIWQNLTQQSQLLTNRALFMLFAVVSLVIMLLIIAVPPISRAIRHWKRKADSIPHRAPFIEAGNV